MLLDEADVDEPPSKKRRPALRKPMVEEPSLSAPQYAKRALFAPGISTAESSTSSWNLHQSKTDAIERIKKRILAVSVIWGWVMLAMH
jgi:hypothetical protein